MVDLSISRGRFILSSQDYIVVWVPYFYFVVSVLISIVTPSSQGFSCSKHWPILFLFDLKLRLFPIKASVVESSGLVLWFGLLVVDES